MPRPSGWSSPVIDIKAADALVVEGDSFDETTRLVFDPPLGTEFEMRVGRKPAGCSGFYQDEHYQHSPWLVLTFVLSVMDTMPHSFSHQPAVAGVPPPCISALCASQRFTNRDQCVHKVRGGRSTQPVAGRAPTSKSRCDRNRR